MAVFHRTLAKTMQFLMNHHEGFLPNNCTSIVGKIIAATYPCQLFYMVLPLVSFVL